MESTAIARIDPDRDEARNGESPEARDAAAGSFAAFAAAHGGGDTPAIDYDELADAGYERGDVESFLRLRDEVDLDQLYLRDRAAREGWLGTERFSEEREILDSEVRDLEREVGDDFGDWMRYASGRPNRVSITEVMGGSPASDAGLRSGDVLLAYDGDRILDVGDLRRGTTAGRAGEPTEVRVMRDGRVLNVDLPRGRWGSARCRSADVRTEVEEP